VGLSVVQSGVCVFLDRHATQPLIVQQAYSVPLLVLATTAQTLSSMEIRRMCNAVVQTASRAQML
jgi:hypothetical protein